MKSQLVRSTIVAAIAVGITLLASACNVVLANRSNVHLQTSVQGPAMSENLQDSKPTGGGSLTIPISPNEKGPES